MTAADVALVVIPEPLSPLPGGFGAPAFSHEVFSHVRRVHHLLQPVLLLA